MIRKIQKSLLILLIGLALAIGLFCIFAMIARVYYIRKNQAFFRNSVEFGTYDSASETVKISIPLEKEIVLSYKSIFAEGSAHYYHNQLPADETRTVYQAVLYAMEHSYSYINVPAADLTPDEIKKAVQFAVLDQPMIEENSGLILDYNEITYSGEKMPRYELILPLNDGIHLEYKKQAYEEARAWVKEMPETAGDERSKAFWLYNKLVSFTRYTADENYNETHPHYIYDALVKGVSNCDGFSNAYSLLLNLAGIESMSVIRLSPETQVGHSWNLLKINGSYFHADPTVEADLYKELGFCLGLYFCRSSAFFEMEDYVEIIKNVLPVCSDAQFDTACIDLSVESTVIKPEEQRELDELLKNMNAEKPVLVISCPGFSDIPVEVELRIVKDWLRNSTRDLKIIADGKRFCFLILI